MHGASGRVINESERKIQFPNCYYLKVEEREMLRQVAEGELLMENQRLEVLLDEDQTVRGNRDQLLINKVVTIQRAWRAYLDRKSVETEALKIASTSSTYVLSRVRQHHQHLRHLYHKSGTHSIGYGTIGRVINLDDVQITDEEDVDEDEFENSDTESAAGTRTMTLSTPEENEDSCYTGIVQGQGRRNRQSKSPQFLALRSLQDSECESILSDCSELGGPLKELEKEVDLVDREELKNYQTPLPSDLQQGAWPLVGDESFQQLAGESSEEYSRRIRKLNFLSLAQEFAELKRINAHACPIDFHLSQNGHATTISSTSLDNRWSLSEANQSSEAAEMESSDRAGESRKSPKIPPGGDCVTDSSVGRGLRTRRNREESAKRNSHHGTPSREARSSPRHERRLSQPRDGDFEVFTMESSIPAMNWDLLEQQLQLAAEEERSRREISLENNQRELNDRLMLMLQHRAG